MASQGLDRLARSTHEEFVEGFTDAVREANVFWYKVAEEGGIVRRSGDSITWQVRSSKDTTTVGPWSDMEEIAAVPVNKWTKANLPFRGVAGSFTVSRTDLWKNDGPNAIFDLMQGLEETLLSDLQEYVEDLLLFNDGSVGSRPHGIPAFIDLADSTPDLTYASIAQSAANSFWQNQYKASSGTGNIIKDMNEFMVTCCRGPNRRRGKPNLVLSNRTLWAVYNSYLVNSVRYRDEKMANAGFDNVMIQSTPFLWSDSMNSTSTSNGDKSVNNHILFLNTRYMRIVKSNPEGGVFVPIQDSRFSPVAELFAYISQFNLVCLSPRQQGDLDATSNTYA